MKRGAHYDIAIIGAGASGLLAAISASQLVPGLRIAVVEKNAEPAKKLYATGNGRCNYMNRYVKPEDFRSAESGGVPACAVKLFSGSSADRMIRFFRELGIEPREEEGGRLYPRSNQAADVVRALLAAVRNAGIEIIWVGTTVLKRHTANITPLPGNLKRAKPYPAIEQLIS